MIRVLPPPVPVGTKPSPSFAIAETFPKNSALGHRQLVCCQWGTESNAGGADLPSFKSHCTSGMVGARTMFLPAKLRKKDGKRHRYFSVVENRRVGQSKTAQRTVLYWGEINDSQEATWRKTLQVFDENHQQYTSLSLFPEDREIPAESSNSIQVKLSAMELRRPRAFGNCWLGCERWRQLRLGELWEEKLSEKVQREIVSWAKVLQLLVVNRLIDPSSEFRLHRQWFDQSAMGGVVGSRFCGGRKRSSLSLLGSHSGAQARLVSASAGAVAGSVPGAV
jgi:hypothetical protein